MLEAAEEWPMLEALMSGTRKMRSRADVLMPRWPAESDEAYKARLHVATLFPAYARTIGVMSGKPFAKALTLSDDMPEKIVQWSDNIDRQGNSLHVFAQEMLREALAYGLAGILVDLPVRTDATTNSDYLRGEFRPYFVRVKH